MTRRLLAAAGLAAVMLTAACGGGSGGGDTYSTAQEIVDAMAAKGVTCAGLELGSGELFTREQGTCTIGAETVEVRTFGDAAAQENWTKAAAQFGGINVSGARWIVSPEKQSTAEQIRTAIGGEIR